MLTSCRRTAAFERADGGALFLDEIGELPSMQQVRLLRVLQSKMINRVGGEQAIPVNVRVIAATNRNLKQMVAENRFREDLWFRLNVFAITIPPLRRGKEDIPALVSYFVGRKCRELGIVMPPAIAPSAFDHLKNCSWPGNIRELENLVERELICHKTGELTFSAQPSENAFEEAAVTRSGSTEYPLPLDDAMCTHIGRALKLTKGKVHAPGGAAELLRVNANTLTSKMRKLGMACGRLIPESEPDALTDEGRIK